MTFTENYSLADIRAATEGGMDGFGGGWLWIIVLFLFIFGGNGFGGRNGDMQLGFDTAEVTRKLDALSNGLCDGFYAQNTTMLNGFAGVTAAVNDARFAAEKSACDIMSAIHADGEATRSLIYQNKVEALQNEINGLKLDKAMCGVVRYPNNFVYSAGNSPFCGCCGGGNI
jgi:hypothetical protein